MNQHKSLASGRWQQFSLPEQMANIGSEVGRAINWKDRGNEDFSQKTFFRAIELFNLTLQDTRNRGRLKEIARAREMFSDFMIGGNTYNSSAEQWEKYFLSFNFLVRSKS